MKWKDIQIKVNVKTDVSISRQKHILHRTRHRGRIRMLWEHGKKGEMTTKNKTKNEKKN